MQKRIKLRKMKRMVRRKRIIREIRRKRMIRNTTGRGEAEEHDDDHEPEGVRG